MGPAGLLTVEEVATRLRVSRATVYKLIQRGELVHLRVAGCIRIPERALVSIGVGTGR
jgi:excisionase family DNA binding protein